MPTCQDVTTHAMRMSGVVGIGDLPEGEEAEFAQAELQGLLDGWFQQGMFGALTDVTETSDYDANEFERVNAATGITVTKPLTISDDDDRAPYDLASLVIVQNAVVERWIYDRQWVQIDDLDLADECPLAWRNMAGLAACLTLRIAPFGNPIDPRTNKAAVDFRTSLMLKAGSRRTQTVEFM